MDLIQVADTSFVLMDADMEVSQVKELLQYTEASHLIIHRQHLGQDLYYLFLIEEISRVIKERKDMKTLIEALDLHEWQATPTLEASFNADNAPDKCVIIREGHVAGFFDAYKPPEEVVRGTRRRGNQSAEEGEEEPVIERNLRADFPEKVPLNDTTSLLVYLTVDQFGETRRDLIIRVPENTVLDVVIQARRGFEIEGKTSGQITVKDEPESSPILFRLKANEIGQGDIRVLVFQNGVNIGQLKLTPIIVEEGNDNLQSSPDSHELLVTTVALPSPDLTLLIQDAEVNGKRGFRVIVSASNPEFALNFKEYGTLAFEVDPGPHFDKFYTDIEKYSLNTPEEREIALRGLEGKGSFLFSKLFSAEAQTKLWEIRERISTVFIQSLEPWIPWELCRLNGIENGRRVEGKFFCEAYAVTRWIPGIPLQPRLNLQNLAVVVPSDSGLPFAGDELAYMMSLAGDKRKVTRIPARYLDLYKAFQFGIYDAWHFSGHGSAQGADLNRSIMLLENQETFTPERIVGTMMNVGLTKPLIFLNACQIGRSGLSLVDIGGWAHQYLLTGAGAFVGAYWSVYDQPAFQFAQELYQRLIAGIPIGEAARQSRLAIRSDGDPTWLAYTVFAHPLAKVR